MAMGRSPFTRVREGIIIAGLNLYNVRREAEFAAAMSGMSGVEEVPYNGETWYRPGNISTSDTSQYIKSFREFIGTTGID